MEVAVARKLAAMGVQLPVYIPGLFQRIRRPEVQGTGRAAASERAAQVKSTGGYDKQGLDRNAYLESIGMPAYSAKTITRNQLGTDTGITGSVVIHDMPEGTGEMLLLGFGTNNILIITKSSFRPQLRAHPLFNECLRTEPPLDRRSFTVEERPGRGKCLVATRDIPANRPIVAEPPLLICGHADVETVLVFDKLLEENMEKSDLADFDALFNCKPFTGPNVSRRHCIVRTNSMRCEMPFTPFPHSGVFKYISRANHSCAPSATYYWSYDTFQLSLISNKNIRKGEEITVAYVEPSMPKADRRERLRSWYYFDCACEKCQSE